VNLFKRFKRDLYDEIRLLVAQAIAAEREKQVIALLRECKDLLLQIKKQGETLMSQNDQLKAALQKIDAATNSIATSVTSTAEATTNIAGDLKTLKEKLEAAGGVDQAVLDSLDASASQLEQNAAVLAEAANTLQGIAAETPEDQA
jgi:methyl-accepting chemotaxis protein